MKKLALVVALGASLVSTAALAEQRPTYLAFSAPAAAPSASTPAPAAPKVGKRKSLFEGLPVIIPIAGGLAALGLVVAVATGGGDSSPG